MTTDARRAEHGRCSCRHSWAMHYDRPVATQSACAERGCMCLVYKTDPAITEAEARGIAKGLEMAAKHFDGCGVHGRWAAGEVRALSQSNTKGGG